MDITLLCVILATVSEQHFVHTEDLPSANLTVEPQGPVFPGELVTLTCNIRSSSGWTYKWYNNHSLVFESEENTFNITTVTESDKGQYWCHGERPDRPTSSKNSSYISLDVIVQPELTQDPNFLLLTGYNVTLRCELDVSSGLSFYWYKNTLNSTPVAQTDVSSYTISHLQLSDGGQYWCRAQIQQTVRHTQHSNGIWVNVTDKPTSIVLSNGTEFFYEETVFLRCEVQGGRGGDWDYRWYRKDYSYSSNEYLRSSAQEYSFRMSNYDDYTYTCSSSSPVSLQISPNRSQHFSRESLSLSCVGLGDTNLPYARLTVEPQGRVLPGETVIFTCNIRSANPKLTQNKDYLLLTGDSVTLRCESDVSSGLSFYWYKNTLNSAPVAQTDVSSYTINHLQLSDGGQYWCRAQIQQTVRHTQYSNGIWVNVTDKPLASITVLYDVTEFFSGETVSLRCEVQGGRVSDWAYSWYEEKSTEPLPSSYRNYRFDMTSSDGIYTCDAKHKNGLNHSARSEPITIKWIYALLTINGSSWVMEGDSVTLSCKVMHSTLSWRYRWYKMIPHSTTQSYTCGDQGHCEEIISDSISEDGSYYNLGPAASKHTGNYTCRAERGGRGRYSPSQPLWVIVSRTPVWIGVGVPLVFCILLFGLLCWFRKRKGASQASSTPPQ
ncbi:Fc receptor-like protein 5 [Engraulis encrasicolus]|uniref:Fc receptor-like protein 5 n=1 Tax=Engraulis encrasicolus TaxID=184585 RepID=UPI002FD775F2